MTDTDICSKRPVTIRTHQAGDLGTIIARHGIIYNQEYGWDIGFEALVARICAEVIENYDPATDKLLVAEDPQTHEFLGSVMLVCDKSLPNTAKLRLLLVEKQARGSGLGGRLINECINFAKGAGYMQIRLWTQSCLFGARRLYQKAGFKLIREEPHESYGAKLVGEFWELPLDQTETVEENHL